MKIRGTTITTPIKREAVADDVSVCQKPWSSKNTVDRLCQAFTESGALVTCEPVEGYPLDVQTAEGANKILRTGKNLLPYPYANSNHTSRGVDFTDNGDGSITINGTSNAAFSAIYNLCTDNLILKDGVTYSLPPVQENIWFCFVYNDAGGTEHTARNLTWSKDYALKRIIILISTMDEISNVTVFPQLEAGTVATAYEPYRGGEFAPGEAVPALAGVNTLWADAGEITVTGRADPNAIIDKLTKAVIALGGNI